MVAQRYLARHPGHPSKVVLACTGARFDLDAISNRFAELGGDAAGVGGPAVLRRRPQRDAGVRRALLPAVHDSALDTDALARVVMNPELMPHFFTGEAATMDLRAGLAAVTCPVLVLGGELDPVMPPQIVRELVDALPLDSTRYEEIPGVSHLQVAGRSASELVKDIHPAADVGRAHVSHRRKRTRKGS